MRFLLCLLVVSMAPPVAADGGFTLGLAEMDFSASAEAAVPAPLDTTISTDTKVQRPEAPAFLAAFKPVNSTERTRALWDDDMARLRYALAAEQSMLGREGLVNGGRMVGLGLGTSIIGDGDPNGSLGFVLGRHKWVEMNANQKFRAGVEVSILAGIVYALATLAD